METIVIILMSIIFLIIIVYGNIKNTKTTRKLEKKLLEFDMKPKINKYPSYVKLDSNINPRVYKIKNIIIVPQNLRHNPELCLVVTCIDSVGNTYNATIDKFVTATEEEYNKNKKEELEF